MKLPELIIRDKENHILKCCSISLKQGEGVCIVSPSPMGKSLLLKALHRLLTESSESKRGKEAEELFDCDIRRLPNRSRKTTNGVYFLDLNDAIIRSRTIQQNIYLPLEKPSIRIKHKITEYLELFGLADKEKSEASTLSFSELKAVELIRLIIQLPSMILIDDFDLCFPKHHRETVYSLLNYVRQNGTSVIVSSREKLTGFDQYFLIENKQLVSHQL